jgi:hypothetical protein
MAVVWLAPAVPLETGRVRKEGCRRRSEPPLLSQTNPQRGVKVRGAGHRAQRGSAGIPVVEERGRGLRVDDSQAGRSS